MFYNLFIWKFHFLDPKSVGILFTIYWLFTRQHRYTRGPPPPSPQMRQSLMLVISEAYAYSRLRPNYSSDMTRNAESMPVDCRAGLGVFGRRTSGLVLQLLKLFGISSILLLTPNPAQRPFVLRFSFCYVKFTAPYFRCVGRSSIEVVFNDPQPVSPLNGHNGNKVELTFCGRLCLSLIYPTCLWEDSKEKKKKKEIICAACWLFLQRYITLITADNLFCQLGRDLPTLHDGRNNAPFVSFEHGWRHWNYSKTFCNNRESNCSPRGRRKPLQPHQQRKGRRRGFRDHG